MFNVADLFARLGLKVDKGSFEAANNLLGQVKGALIAVAGLGAVRWAHGQLKQLTDMGDKLDEMSQSTGIATDALQEIGYAAGFSGISIDGVSQSLGILTRNAGAAARGGKEMNKAFKEVGVNAKDLAKGRIPLTDALGSIADKFASMEDGSKKQILAMQLFGRSGRQLIPFLNEGREGLEKLRKEAHELGVVIDGETISAMAEFNDDTDKLGHAWTGVKLLIARELLPTILKFVTALRKWLIANRQLLAEKITTFVRVLGRGLRILWETLGLIIETTQKLIKTSSIFRGVLIALAAAFVGLKIASVASAIASGAAWTLANLPLVLLGLLIAGVILVLQDLYVWFNKGDSIFKEWYEAAAKWIGEKLEALLDSVADKVNKIFPLFKQDKRSDALKEAMASGEITPLDVMKNSAKVRELQARSGRTGSGEKMGAGFEVFRDDPISMMQANLRNLQSQTIKIGPARVMAPQFNATINVTGGGDPQATARHVREQMSQMWDEKMRDMDPGEDQSR